jgi:putative lipoprotein
MKRLTINCLSLLLLSALPTQARTIPIATYQCDQGKTFQVQFEQRSAFVSLGRNSFRLPQLVSASGANYSNQTYRLFTKGKRAFLSMNNQVIYRNCFAQTSREFFAKVTGTVTYRERVALPPGAIVEVELQDVSILDAPAVVLDRQRIPVKRQVPISFTLKYDPQRIDPDRIYTVQARILVKGQPRFITTSTYRVLTQDNPSDIKIVVQPIGSNPK